MNRELTQISFLLIQLGLLWLPKEFPSNVRVILTCSPGNKYYDHLSPKTQSYDNQVVYLNPLADSEKRLLIDRYLTLYSKKLSFSQTQQILEAKLSNNPLFLCCLLQRLVMCGDFDTLNRYIDNFTYCRSLEHFFEVSFFFPSFILFDSFFKVVIKEVTQQIFVPDKKNFASDVLNLICLSRYGMVEAELIAIMEVYSHIPYAAFSVIIIMNLILNSITLHVFREN